MFPSNVARVNSNKTNNLNAANNCDFINNVNLVDKFSNSAHVGVYLSCVLEGSDSGVLIINSKKSIMVGVGYFFFLRRLYYKYRIS